MLKKCMEVLELGQERALFTVVNLNHKKVMQMH